MTNAPLLARPLAHVRFQTEVIDRGIIVKRSEPSRNLVLDTGLDMTAGIAYAQATNFLALGTSSNPTKRDSGLTTIRRTGNAVIASADFFVAGDVGRLVKLDSGAEFYLTAVADATHATARTEGENAASEATVWYVNDTGHGAEFLRINSYAQDAGSNQSTFTAGAWTHRRTFLSAPFSVGKLVTEVGWSPSSSGALYGRALVPGGGDYVAAGQQYKVTVDHVSNWGPATAQVQGNVGNNGFNTAGKFALEYVPEVEVPASGQINGEYVPTYRGDAQCLCFAGTFGLTMGTSAAELTPLAGAQSNPYSLSDVLGVNVTKLSPEAYVAGSFRRTFVGTVPVGSGNSAAIRSILINITSNARAGRILLDAPQTKDNLHTLTVRVAFGWGRVLNN